MNVGKVVKKERERRGWSQRDLAVSSGVPQSVVGRLERTEVHVNLTTLLKIAKGFDSELVITFKK